MEAHVEIERLHTLDVEELVELQTAVVEEICARYGAAFKFSSSLAEPDSPRRRLMLEILEERSKVVATRPVVEEDPPASSWRWPAGISKLVLWAPQDLRLRRRIALDVCVCGFAWLERVDAELKGAGDD